MENYLNEEKEDFQGECPVTVHFNFKAYSKLRTYINNVENEVGGIGEIKADYENNHIVVKDVFLIEQEVTGASTKLDTNGLMKFYAERLELNPEDKQKNYKLWWHSHFNFTVFWSGQDNTCINWWDQQTKKDNWVLSVVGNQAGELLVRLDMFYPFKYTFNHIPYTFDLLPETVHKGLLKEIKKKVRVVAPVAYNNNGYAYNNEDEETGEKVNKKHGKNHPDYIKHLLKKGNLTAKEQKEIKEWWKKPANTTAIVLAKFNQEAMPYDDPDRNFKDEELAGGGVAGASVAQANGTQELINGEWGTWWNGIFYPDYGGGPRC